MLVPVHIWRDFYEPNTRLHGPPGHQALTTEVIRYRRPDAIAALNRNRFAFQVHHGREVSLHPECQLIAGDRSIHLLQMWRRGKRFLMKFLDEVELLALRCGF